MRFHARKRLRFGPFVINFTQRGYSSWGIKLWRYTWNSKTGESTFDTPGPGSVTWGGHRGSRP